MKYIIGLGKTGVSVVRYFLEHQIPFIAWDDTPVLQEKVQLMGGAIVAPSQAPWHAVEELILSPGIPTTFPTPHVAVQLAKKYHIPYVGDVEYWYKRTQYSGYRYVGVTGTNGKSTTHAIIDYVLNALNLPHFSGGNSGVPVLDAPKLASGAVINLEMSSYQLDILDQMTFDAGVILNITPDHLDRHGNMENYILSKITQITRVKPGGLKVVGVDCPGGKEAYDSLTASGQTDIIPISATQVVEKGIYTVGNQVISTENDGNTVLGLIPDSLPGAHNAQNVMAAMLVCRHLEIDVSEFFRVLPSYPGLAHRQERVLDTPKALFINDSKATNADATLPALKTYLNVYWIVGGIAKDEGVVPLLPYLEYVEKIFLIGESAERFQAELKSVSPLVLKMDTLDNAMNFIAKELDQADHKVTVLLSPACASQDQFQNFEHRGRVFTEIVQQQFGSK
ncbi:UDP-N-acetylmuramoyl-L-alanine--D-glutamate ligase [Candidatus Bodocaedibacter vickermanii]|uniref:UDP-N-acetylmuramoylalanine--D-glutamate ligase n=1 Tax=Candidatus Bodocaedibacter vickermanii TaxID=2741701 RepID=A0A7L9RV52_9PROT|nr:UDP-N-acetylmuramoylalanine--D-glutamate ligase [Candidatus Paracaedibacteraceae bacterium 'Lake Konstanz']